MVEFRFEIRKPLQGLIEPILDGPYPFSELPAALQRFGEARHVGKVVVSLDA